MDGWILTVSCKTGGSVHHLASADKQCSHDIFIDVALPLCQVHRKIIVPLNGLLVFVTEERSTLRP